MRLVDVITIAYACSCSEERYEVSCKCGWMQLEATEEAARFEATKHGSEQHPRYRVEVEP